MVSLRKVLCLGNQTQHTDICSQIWADRLGLPSAGLISSVADKHQGVYHPDLAYLTIDEIWTLVDHADLTIVLDQPMHSYEQTDTYHSLISLARFKQRSRPVMIEGHNDPNIWLTDLHHNDRVLEHLAQRDLLGANLVLRLYEVHDIELFQRQMRTIDDMLTSAGCRWVVYRASAHEHLHFEATQILLDYPQFVLLNPAVFEGPVANNIRQKIYHHWIQLYL